jgi:hypothetical protein
MFRNEQRAIRYYHGLWTTRNGRGNPLQRLRTHEETHLCSALCGGRPRHTDQGGATPLSMHRMWPQGREVGPGAAAGLISGRQVLSHVSARLLRLCQSKRMAGRKADAFDPDDGSPIPAAAYIRMSTEHQRYSADNQLDAINVYAAERGFEVAIVYSDLGKSGLNIEGRPGLQQLLRDVLGAPPRVQSSSGV